MGQVGHGPGEYAFVLTIGIEQAPVTANGAFTAAFPGLVEGFDQVVFPAVLLGQRDKAKESAVKEGVHSIQVGVQSYAVDNNDTYPTAGGVSSASMTAYVDIWPKNPWSNSAMTDASSQGNFAYSLPTSSSFRLVGYGKGGTGVITVP